MENGVSGGDVGRACRNDNENDAVGKGATGRRSSGAKGGEPIKVRWRKHRIGMAKEPHWCDMSVSVSQPGDPPAVIYMNWSRVLLSTERRRKKSFL
jgi:hypothetical protein